MHRLAITLTIPIAALMSAGAAQAQAAGAGAGAGEADQPEQPRITVQASERMVCRAVSRTATRMRTARVCRPVSQLRGADARGDDERLAEEEDRLDGLRQEHSTGCMGGMAGVDDIQGNPAHRNPDSR